MAKKSLKMDRGTVYQKTDGGTFYYRYQVNGQRKAVSLQTKKFEEAKKKAGEMESVVTAPSLDVVAAHISHANFGLKRKELSLGDAWEVYSRHPNRATPATVWEQQAYKITWHDFLGVINDDNLLLDKVTHEHAAQYADYLRNQEFAVDTHNRKIQRLQKVFSTLREYTDNNNPFSLNGLRRKSREEQNAHRRIAFTKEQEQQLLDELENGKHKLKNKHEIRILFYLGMFTGQRLKDCALMQWNCVDLVHRRIWVKQFKTGKKVMFPIADRLAKVLKEAQEWKSNDYVLPAVAARYQIVDKNGKDVGSNLLNIDVMRVIRWIGVEPSVKVPGRKKKVTVYGFHSLRHSFASHCAEAGVPKAVAQSILGAGSDIIDKYYVHIGEEAQLKAIQAVGFGPSNPTPQDSERIKDTLAYIESLDTKSPEMQHVEKLLREGKKE